MLLPIEVSYSKETSFILFNLAFPQMIYHKIPLLMKSYSVNHVGKHWFTDSADAVGQLAENRLQDVSMALTRMETRWYSSRESSQEKKPEINFLKFTILSQRAVGGWLWECSPVKSGMCVSGGGTQGLTFQTEDLDLSWVPHIRAWL